METCLIVCARPSGLAALERCRSRWPIVVASDDPRVRSHARRLPGVIDVTALERPESFWVIAPETKAILARLETWLASLDASLPADTFTWSGTIEGGLLGQRVQDALLVIRSYQHLFHAFDVREVQMIVEPADEWEAGVLCACAGAASVAITCHRPRAFRSWVTRAGRRAAPFAKAGYLAARELSLGASERRRHPSQVGLDGGIVFQLCSSAGKHIDNVRYLMASLGERRLPVAALCWAAGERRGPTPAADVLRTAGLDAIGLERFVGARHVASSGLRATRIVLRGRRRRLELDPLEYRGVALAPVLEESIHHFLVAVLPARLRYAVALERGLAGARPRVVKPWGGHDVFEGRLALRLTERTGAQFLQYWVGVGFPGWPYASSARTPDIFLAKSTAEGTLAKAEYGITDAQVHVVGQPRWTHVRAFGTTHTAADSRRVLGMPPDAAFYVGLDAGASLRGYQSREEQASQLLATLAAARAAPGMVVAIKAHPAHPIDHLMPIVEEYGGPNVIVLPRAASVDHFLNAIDVVVSKYSTLLLEAALRSRVALAALLDGDERFKVFGDLAAVVTSPAALQDLLTRLGTDGETRRSWLLSEHARQAALLPLHSADQAGDAAARGAAAVASHLEPMNHAAAG